MKQFGLAAILLSTIMFLVAGCASQDSVTDQTTKSTVPGEKVDDEARLAPGAGTNASVRW